MVDRNAGPQTTRPRKLKKEQTASTRQTVAQAERRPKIGDPNVRAHLEKGISELKGLQKLLLSNEVDPDVLEAFRSALNRVRNTAWAAQQYIICKESSQDSGTVLALLAGEHIRATYQLCQALSDDLKRTDIEFQRGNLVELYEATKNLTGQLKRVIEKL